MVVNSLLGPAFRERIRSFRVGSPVQVGDIKSFITELPSDKDVAINGFKVFNDSSCHSIEDLKPIPLDEDFFLRHENYFTPTSEGCCCITNEHRITITKEERICYIDGEEYGPISRHELRALLEDLCGITIPVFDGLF